MIHDPPPLAAQGQLSVSVVVNLLYTLTAVLTHLRADVLSHLVLLSFGQRRRAELKNVRRLCRSRPRTATDRHARLSSLSFGSVWAHLSLQTWRRGCRSTSVPRELLFMYMEAVLNYSEQQTGSGVTPTDSPRSPGMPGIPRGPTTTGPTGPLSP